MVLEDCEITSPVKEEFATDAEKALAGVWARSIGKYSELINVNQLGKLFRAQGLCSSDSDVIKTFQVIDEDKDGFVSFTDLAQQMENFFLPTSPLQVNEAPEKAKPSESKEVRTPTRFLTRPNILSTEEPPSSVPPPLFPQFSSEISVKSNLNSSSALDQLSARADHVTVTSNNAIPSLVVNHSHEMSKSEIVTPTFSKDNSDTAEHNDTMRSYHGVPPYRLRRRSTQASLRHQRHLRRTTSLPHYHPISRISVENCALYFLTEERDR